METNHRVALEHIQFMTTDALRELINSAEAIIAERSFKEGDPAFFVKRAAAGDRPELFIIQGRVANTHNGCVRIKCKGDYTWKYAIPASRVFKTLELAQIALKERLNSLESKVLSA